jgi:hypothetical protein
MCVSNPSIFLPFLRKLPGFVARTINFPCTNTLLSTSGASLDYAGFPPSSVPLIELRLEVKSPL